MAFTRARTGTNVSIIGPELAKTNPVLAQARERMLAFIPKCAGTGFREVNDLAALQRLKFQWDPETSVVASFLSEDEKGSLKELFEMLPYEKAERINEFKMK